MQELLDERDEHVKELIAAGKQSKRQSYSGKVKHLLWFQYIDTYTFDLH